MRLMEREQEQLASEPAIYQQKMILKNGIRHILLNTKDILYCYSSNKVVYIIDIENHRYISDKSLIKLEAELDPKMFFKANRTHIINFNYIRSFVTFEKNKMKVELNTPRKEETVIVSQPRVGAFKQWIYNHL